MGDDVLMDILRAFDSMGAWARGEGEVREAEEYGDVQLSVQASRMHYCEPQVTGLPLGEYKTVEVAVLMNGRIVRPEEAGLGDFKDLFEDGEHPVAGFVPQATVNRMRAVLRQRALANA